MNVTRALLIVAATLLGVGLLAARAQTPPASSAPGWTNRADRALGWGPGMGRRLMTEDEWQRHHAEMQSLQGEDRERARREWHERMRRRAEERGITLPATPGPHGRGPGGPPPK